MAGALQGVFDADGGSGAALAAGLLGRLAELDLNYGKAARHYATAVLLTPADQALTQARYLSDEGVSLLRLGEHGPAMASFEQALSIRLHQFGWDHIDIAEALEGNDPTLVPTLIQRGSVQTDQERYEAAELTLERALGIAGQPQAPDVPRLSQVLGSLAALYRRQKRYAEAGQLLQRQWELALSTKGEVRALPLLAEQADLLLEQRRYLEAERTLRQAFEIAESFLGPDSPEAAQFQSQYRAQVLKRVRE